MNGKDISTVFRRRRLVFSLCVLCMVLFGSVHVRAAGTYSVSGTIEASKLINDGYEHYDLRINGESLTLKMDKDISLHSIKTSTSESPAILKITGPHTLKLDTTDLSGSENYQVAALYAMIIEIDGATVQAHSTYSGIYAKSDLKITNASVTATGSWTAIRSANRNVTIQNSKINCADKINGNGILANETLTIKNSTVKAYGSHGALLANGAMNISDCSLSVSGKNMGIFSGGDITITGGKADIQSGSGTGEVDYWAGIAGFGSVQIDNAAVTASGNPSGIFGAKQSNTKIVITNSSVNATGKKSAISSNNPIVLGTGLGVIKPSGGSIGKTDWNSDYPYGIVTGSSATAKNAVIGVPKKEGPKEKADALLKGVQEKDETGSVFLKLRAKAVKVTSKSVKLSWKKVSGASYYLIYGTKCGKNNEFVFLTKTTGKSWTHKKRKKGTYYRYVVVACSSSRILTVSKTVHAATSGGKEGNPKSVKLNKKKISLKKGKTFKLKATVKKGNGRIKTHRKPAYETDNPKVATVDKKGKIKAVSKGTCYVYAYAQNGVFAKCKVTVK